MSDTIIKVDGLSKKYRLGATHGYKTFRESLVNAVKAPFSKSREREEVWALKDVSFEVKRGEVLGIIGRNGAGKSTLLKILSRITEPTSGRVELRGRVGSLLEVGTGFHPELTGKENVYLYGTILGMRSSEISRKYDEIVAFAELERFMETPVKRYSSGMYMRLAFSVAAHLEPEILLVDEVLAVGDAIFQRKCIKKMQEAASCGRTILFVSHNIPAITSFCGRAILFEGGSVSYAGGVEEAVDKYLGAANAAADRGRIGLKERQDRSGSGAVRLTDFYMLDGAGNRIGEIRSGSTVQLAFEYGSADGRPARNVELQIVVSRYSGDRVFQFGTRFAGRSFAEAPARGRIVCRLKRFPLPPERYRLDAYLVSEAVPADYLQNAAFIDVVDGDFYGSGYQVFEKETPFLVDGDVSLEGAP